MRWLVAIIAWTLVVVVVVLLVPGSVNTPGCMSLIEPSSACLEELRVQNDRIWWTRTLPLILLVSSGYIAIAAGGLRARRLGRG